MKRRNRMPKKPYVAIIGRANVGKSTLFNRLVTGSRALVSPIPGTTRDRKEGDCLWCGKYITLIDTGGLDISARDTLEQKIADQARVAIKQADLLLFVVDTKAGVMPADVSIAQFLRTIQKPMLLVANKADSLAGIHLATEFYSLGFGSPLAVSAINGRGTGDLLDEIMARVKPIGHPTDTGITITIIGKPNVGKSTLFNTLIGEERAIVHDEPFTTRDTNAISFTFHGQKLVLLDTAGVRQKRKIDPRSIEVQSAHRALESIYHADVILLVTEAHERLTHQDQQLARLAGDSKASIIIVGNKWDLAPEDAEGHRDTPRFEAYVRRQLNFIAFAPIVFLSARYKINMNKLKHAIIRVYREQYRHVANHALDTMLRTAVKKQRPTIGRGVKKPFIYNIRQVGIRPPQFAVTIDAKTSLRYTYLNFLERCIREAFGFEGVPIKMWVEKHQRNKP